MKSGRHQCRAVILGRVNYGESDLVVSFFSQEFGRLSGMAKYGRKSRKRFGNVLAPGGCVDLDFTCKPGRELVRLEGGSLVRAYENLGQDVNLLALSAQTLELVESFCPPQDPSPEIFNLLLWCQDRLERNERSLEALFIFKVRLLALAGFGPNVVSCCLCGGQPREGDVCGLKADQGGLVCASCAGGGIRVSLGALKLMALSQSLDLGKIDRVRINDRVINEADSFLLDYIRHILGRDLKTAAFLEKLRRPDGGRATAKNHQ